MKIEIDIYKGLIEAVRSPQPLTYTVLDYDADGDERTRQDTAGRNYWIHQHEAAQEPFKAPTEYDGLHCPSCGTPDIDLIETPIDRSGAAYWLALTCKKCNATWTEHYHLDGITNLETP